MGVAVAVRVATAVGDTVALEATARFELVLDFGPVQNCWKKEGPSLTVEKSCCGPMKAALSLEHDVSTSAAQERMEKAYRVVLVPLAKV